MLVVKQKLLLCFFSTQLNQFFGFFFVFFFFNGLRFLPTGNTYLVYSAAVSFRRGVSGFFCSCCFFL